MDRTTAPNLVRRNTTVSVSATVSSTHTGTGSPSTSPPTTVKNVCVRGRSATFLLSLTASASPRWADSVPRVVMIDGMPTTSQMMPLRVPSSPPSTTPATAPSHGFTPACINVAAPTMDSA